jgi:hypothetical protein
MATTNPITFLLNRSTDTDGQVVGAPAFSLTKVLTTTALVVTPIVTLITTTATDVTLTSGNFVALCAAVLGFLAIASAADVLARSIATAAQSKAKAAAASVAQLVRFNPPLPASHILRAADKDVDVVGVVHTGEPLFLVLEEGSLKWLPTSEVALK